MSESLGEALPKEQACVRKIIVQYNDPMLNGAGAIAAGLMEADLKETDKAVMEGDVVAMMRMYQKLKEWES